MEFKWDESCLSVRVYQEVIAQGKDELYWKLKILEQYETRDILLNAVFDDCSGIKKNEKLHFLLGGEDPFGNTAIIASALNGDLKTLKELIKIGANVNAGIRHNKITPLMVASGHGHIDCVKALLKAGSDINAENVLGETALMYASKRSFAEIIAELKSTNN